MGRPHGSRRRARGYGVGLTPGSRLLTMRPSATARTSSGSNPEDLAVARLDLVGHLLDSLGVLAHQLDVGELAHPRLLDGLGVRGILPSVVDQQLLALAPMQPAEEQARGVRI